MYTINQNKAPKLQMTDSLWAIRPKLSLKTSLQTKDQDWKNSPLISIKSSRNTLYQFFICSINITKGTLPNSFYQASNSIFTPKQEKTLQKTKPYRQIFLMNMDAKILNKILVNQIQGWFNKIIHYNQVGFIPETWGWVTYINQ